MSITYDQEPPVSIPDLEVEPAPSAEAEPKLAPAQEMAAAWRNFCELYLTFDRRTLGLTRILLGFYLIFDLFRRTSDWWKLFSNEGVLPSHYNLWRPQSNGWTLLNAFSTRGELWVLWAFILAVFVALMVGYKTRVMQVLAALLVVSMNGRVLLIENGGYVVQNLLLLWTAFLPLGDRFSVDALLDSWRAKREGTVADLNARDQDTSAWRLTPHTTLLGIVLILQLGAIYFFNVKHKTGPGWQNHSAVHFVLYVDRMANPPVAMLRDYIPNAVAIGLGRTAMFFEAFVPICLLSPFGRKWTVRLALLSIVCMHIGFGTTFVLGPFAWALCVFATLLFSRHDWDIAVRTMRREHRARTVRYNPASAAAFWWCRLLKRLDRFELLRFERDPSIKSLALAGAIDRMEREQVADVVAALPAGPVWAAPLRIPGLGGMLYAPFKILGGLPRFFGHATTGRVEREGRTEQPAERHAIGPNTTIEFIFEWLDDYVTKRWGWMALRLASVSLVLGVLLTIYGAPFYKRFKFNPKLALWGSGAEAFTVADAFFWAGIPFLLFAAYQILRPWLTMIFTVESSMKVKRLRLLAGLREALIVVMWWGAINQAVVELWVFRGAKIPQPPATQVLAHKFRYLQGWFMFSPNPVMDDGTIVTEALTVDGRWVDPFSIDAMRTDELQPPNFDLLNAKSFGYNQIWSDYYNRMHMAGNTRFRKPMKDYIFRLQDRTGNPNDAIVKGAVYWVHDNNPRMNSTKSYGYSRKKLFSFTNPDRDVQKRFRKAGGHTPPPVPAPWGPTEK